jgi:hypothetical protein
MWQKWGPNGRGTYLPTCPHLQAYQVPLKRPGEESRWGKVDLLGVSPEFLPVVNELKQPESNENVLRMLTEMAAYGIAVQEAWPTLRCEWEPAMRARFGDAVRVPEHLERVSVIGVAPTAFWARHLGWPGSDGTRRVPDEAWPCVCALVAAFREYHLDISFAVVEGTAEGQALLPTVTGARRLKLCGEGRGGAVPSP